MSKLKSDSATSADCDWGFIEDDEVMAGLRSLARRYGGYGNDPAIDAEDLLQEAVLWLGVRPELTQDSYVGFIVTNARQRLKQVVDRKRLDIDELDEEAYGDLPA